MENLIGNLYGVSVGPGDPELMTLKAVRIINSCEVLAVPRTGGKNTLALEIVRGVCDISQKDVVYLDFPMTSDKKMLDEMHIKSADMLLKYLKSGKNIAFVNLGDIAVYSTFSYIAEIIRKNGIAIEYCPGVTSFCAAAALAGKPLVQGKKPLVVMPSSCENFGKMLGNDCTAVIMKSGKNLSYSLSELKKSGYDNVYAVCDCGLKTQNIYKELENIPDSCGYFTIVTASRKEKNV